MFTWRKISASLAAFGLLVAHSAAWAAPRSERVVFAKGATSKVIKGSIKGYDYVDYVIRARGGQSLTVSLTSNRGSNYFNIMPSGDPSSFYNGSIDGNLFRGPVPASGDQIIRVYLMRNDARRGVTATYTLTISIVG